MTGIVLGIGAVVSVLAFGGVEILAFIPVEVLIAILAVYQFWRRGWPKVSRPMLWVLGILVAIPLLQLLPLPAPLMSLVSPARVTLTRNVFSSINPAGSALAVSVNSYETQIAVLRLVCYALVFLLAFQACRLQREPTILIGVLVGLGVFEAVWGIIQYLSGWQYFFYYNKWVIAQGASGSYVNRNHFAGLLGMILPFVLARVLIRNPGREQARRFGWKELIVSPLSSNRLGDMAVFVLIAIGLIFSRSRMGLVATAAGAVLVAIIAFLQTRRRSTLVIAFLALTIPLGYSFWIGLDPVVERFQELNQESGSEGDRLPIWSDTVALIRDYPLVGTGLGTYHWASLHYQSHMLDIYYDHAHNDYLEFAADIGIPTALLLFGGLWILAVSVARKAPVLERTKDRILAAGCAGAMAALLTHSIADFDLQIPANAYIFAWIAGTGAALLRRPAAESQTGAIRAQAAAIQ